MKVAGWGPKYHMSIKSFDPFCEDAQDDRRIKEQLANPA